MYARDVDGRTLRFGVSGMLWNAGLVMYDTETNSLWSHILGEAMKGPLRGKRLEMIPSAMTDWGSWKARHPDGTVAMLSRTSHEYTREFHAKPHRFVLGIASGAQAKSWSFDLLKQSPVLLDEWDGQPVVVAFDRASMTARLYDRRMDDLTLSFRTENNKLTDDHTGSSWDPITGRALTGPLRDRYLNALPAIVSDRSAWFRFHPNSREAGAKTAGNPDR